MIIIRTKQFGYTTPLNIQRVRANANIGHVDPRDIALLKLKGLGVDIAKIK